MTSFGVTVLSETQYKINAAETITDLSLTHSCNCLMKKEYSEKKKNDKKVCKNQSLS